MDKRMELQPITADPRRGSPQNGNNNNNGGVPHQTEWNMGELTNMNMNNMHHQNNNMNMNMNHNNNNSATGLMALDYSETSTQASNTDAESFTDDDTDAQSISRASSNYDPNVPVTAAVLAARRANEKYAQKKSRQSQVSSINSPQFAKRRERKIIELDDAGSDWGETDSVEFAKHSLMVEHLYKACKAKGWLEASGDEGAVSLRVSSTVHAKVIRGDIAKSELANDVASSVKTPAAPMFVTYPEPNAEFTRAVRGLNVEVAIMLTSKIIRSAIEMVPEVNRDLRLRDGSKLQVLDSIQRLPRARKLQYAALLRQEGALVVWTNSIDTIIDS
ncbi:hypothetical protein HDU76_008677, partial [Blyttiomyces sp. JEL0837]